MDWTAIVSLLYALTSVLVGAGLVFATETTLHVIGQDFMLKHQDAGSALSLHALKMAMLAWIAFGVGVGVVSFLPRKKRWPVYLIGLLLHAMWTCLHLHHYIFGPTKSFVEDRIHSGDGKTHCGLTVIFLMLFFLEFLRTKKGKGQNIVKGLIFKNKDHKLVFDCFGLLNSHLMLN